MTRSIKSGQSTSHCIFATKLRFMGFSAEGGWMAFFEAQINAYQS
jgi:hypothetical protein